MSAVSDTGGCLPSKFRVGTCEGYWIENDR